MRTRLNEGNDRHLEAATSLGIDYPSQQPQKNRENFMREGKSEGNNPGNDRRSLRQRPFPPSTRICNALIGLLRTPCYLEPQASENRHPGTLVACGLAISLANSVGLVLHDVPGGGHYPC